MTTKHKVSFSVTLCLVIGKAKTRQSYRRHALTSTDANRLRLLTTDGARLAPLVRWWSAFNAGAAMPLAALPPIRPGSYLQRSGTPLA